MSDNTELSKPVKSANTGEAVLRLYIERSCKVNLGAEFFATEEGEIVEARLKDLESETTEALRQRDLVWGNFEDRLRKDGPLPADHPYWSSPDLKLLRCLRSKRLDLRRQANILAETVYAANHKVEALSDSREPVEIPLPRDPEGLVSALKEAVDQVAKLTALHGEVTFHLEVD